MSDGLKKALGIVRHIADLLPQSTTWVTADKRVIPIREMDASHRLNTMNMLRSNATLIMLAHAPTPDTGVSMWVAGQGDPLQWLASQPLYIAMEEASRQTPKERWGKCCPREPDCEHSFMSHNEVDAWMNQPLLDRQALSYEGRRKL